jgi:hypothetical protein
MLYADGEDIVADCRLTGSRHFAGHAEPQLTTHFTGTVRLSRTEPVMKQSAIPKGTPDVLGDTGGIYRIYFHGPAYQVLEEVSRDGERIIGAMPPALPDNHRPADHPTLAAPRLIELCFQTAGIAEIHSTATLGLPQRIDSVTFSRIPDAGDGPFHAVVNHGRGGGVWDGEVIDASGRVCLVLRGYRTVALEGVVDTSALMPVHAAVH